MPQARTFAGVYEMMDFPAYQFREFPKAIQVEVNGKTEDRIVQNEAEEAELLDTLTADEAQTSSAGTAEEDQPTGRRRR